MPPSKIKLTVTPSAEDDMLLQTHHEVSLPVGGRLSITCADPITINGIMINEPITNHPEVPVTIEAIEGSKKDAPETSAMVPSSEKEQDAPQPVGLGATFVQGWNKLPAELKLHILSFDLSHPWRKFTSSSYELRPYVQMTPEIAALAREVFYTHNTIRIVSIQQSREGVWGTLKYWTFLYPKPAVNHFIRTLWVRIHFHVGTWKFIESLACGTYGFPNVKYMTLRVDCTNVTRGSPHTRTDNGATFAQIFHAGAVRFKCKGRVELVFSRHTRILEEEWGQVYECFGEKVIFEGGRGVTKVFNF